MGAQYFANFNRINYNGSNAINIMQRTKITNNTMGSPFAFYPYELKEGDRPDIIADQYYDDDYFSWLVYFSNKIVDPYYGWYLSDDDFNALLVEKYGSIENAQEKIAFYRNNWYNDDTQISESYYETNVVPLLKKYYTPFIDDNDNIQYYYRTPEDWMINTNEYVSFNVTYNSNTAFSNNEIVNLVIWPDNIGRGQVFFQNTSVVILKHISGNTTANNIVLEGRESNASANVLSANVIEQNITLDEAVFWDAVTYYDVENEINEDKKIIKLMDNRFSSMALTQLQTLMANN